MNETDVLIFDPTPDIKGFWSLEPDMYLQFSATYYPNWFYRMMQRCVLGIYWKKV